MIARLGTERRGPSSARVCVLLSTFNGQAFLAQQLDSLLNQEGVEIDLHARDDGSSDATAEILAQYADHWPNIANIESGPNLGPARSFLRLLQTAPSGAQFFAFCDQDDVWLPQKLARATAALAQDVGPALYYSGVTPVSATLEAVDQPPDNGTAELPHLLFENVAPGCTIVMNRAARDLLAARPPERGLVMHDWWCVLVIAATGRVHHDPEPQILYRQHAANVIGAPKGRWSLAQEQLARLLRDPGKFYSIHGQAAEVLRLFGPELSPPDHQKIERLVSSKVSVASRVRYAMSSAVNRTRFLDRLVVRGLILAGWY